MTLPPFKPLERALEKLEELAKKGDVKGFERESEMFYVYMPILEGYKSFMGERAVEMTRHYQSRYEQVKLMLGRR